MFISENYSPFILIWSSHFSIFIIRVHAACTLKYKIVWKVSYLYDIKINSFKIGILICITYNNDRLIYNSTIYSSKKSNRI